LETPILTTTKSGVATNASDNDSLAEALGSIEQFIELANSLPDEVHGVARDDPEFEAAIRAIESGDHSKMAEWRTGLAQDAERLLPGSGGWTEIHSFLIYVRDSLRAVARLPKPPFPFEPKPIELQSPLAIEELWQDAQGVLHIGALNPELIQLHALFRALLNGLDATRVRECSICSKLFWVKRRDQKACSNVCANRFRVRKSYRKARDEKRSVTKKISITKVRSNRSKREKQR
jgi:hypothetical protein